MSLFFIKRPVFTIVVSLLIVLFGALSIKNMPVSQFPKLTPPTVSISATFPGADAETVMTGVVEPIEAELSGLPNVMYMTSSASNSGSGNIVITFDIGTNTDAAITDIQNRIRKVEPLLPAATKQLGVSINQKTSDMLMVASFYSDKKDSVEISNFVSNNVLKHIKMVKGAGEARIFGQKDYAMRIWTDPYKLKQYNISSKEISAAIQEQNFQASVGRIGQEPVPSGQMLTISMKTEGRLKTVKDFEEIIVKTNSNYGAVKLKDLAKIELGTDTYEFYSRINGKQAVMVGISADSKANALDTANAVKQKLKDLSKTFPEEIKYSIPYDTTIFVDLSIKEVVKTLFEAVVLVTIVIFLFLQSLRASILPLVAIPVSIMGAFIGMYIFGYTINTLTLFGLVLAIGIVVDDAIVVVENIERIINEEKIPAYEASIKAMKQITSPIIAIVLVLSAIFLPTMFIGGVTGEMYKQFAITIAVSVFFSGLVALTLTPTMAASILKHQDNENKNIIQKILEMFNNNFQKMTHRYVNFSMKMIENKKKTFAVYFAILASLIVLIYKMPTAFLPQEDNGVFMVVASLPEGATFERTNKVLDKIEPIVMKEPGVENVIAMVGLNMMSDNGGPTGITMFVRLKHWDQRKDAELKSQAIIQSLQKKLTKIDDAEIMVMQPPAIRGMGRSNGLQFRILSTSNDRESLSRAGDKFTEDIMDSKKFIMAMTTTKQSSPSIILKTDVEKAKTYGVLISDIFDEIQSSIAYKNINQFEKDGHAYWVKVQSSGEYRVDKKALNNIFVKNNKNEMVPVSQFVSIEETVSPSMIEHFNGVNSISINSMMIPIYSSGTGIETIENIAKKIPGAENIAWEGMSYQQKIVGNNNVIMLSLAFLMVFLILAAQYGKWVLPLAVIFSIPFGMFGAYIGILINMMPKDIYFQIGLLTLIGLSAKNAILVIEFAEEERRKGLSIYEATKKACYMRYRPMMMTSFAFIFGMLPLIMSSGAGAESRFSIGVCVIGGMIAATFVERYFIPFIYYNVATFAERFKK